MSFSFGGFESFEWDPGGFDFLSGGGSFDLPGRLPTVTIPEVRLPPITIGGGGSARDSAVRIVNAYEPVFANNRDRYRAGQIGAAEAQDNFRLLWQEMAQRLAALGAEGQRAIADRQQGGKFDWWLAYDQFPLAGGGTFFPPVQTTGGTGAGFPGGGPLEQFPTQPQGLSVGGLALLAGLGYLLFR